MFLFVGGIVGFLLALFLIAGPTAVVMAAQLGLTSIWPLQLFTPLVSVTLLGGLLSQLIVVLVLYVIAAIATPPVQGKVTTNWVEELCRGAQLGMNSCANLLYAAVLYPAIAINLFSPAAAVITAPLAAIMAATLGVINFLCIFPGLTTNFTFEAVLGWTSWFMPMSWPYQLLGFVVYLIGLVASWAGRPFEPLGDWWPGAVARHGWLFDFGSSVFTIGNFTIVSDDLDRTSPSIALVAGAPKIGFLTALGVVAHETGHVLTLAAFGFLFNVVGWVHERILELFTHFGGRAYFEFLCEGIRRMSGDPTQFPDANPWIAMWAPPVPLSGAQGGNARVTVDATADGDAITSAGTSIVVAVNAPVNLVATGCVDPDNYPMGTISPGGTPTLGFRWRVTLRPSDSTAAIPHPRNASTTFTADVFGSYKITFAVTDGAEGESHVIDVTA